MLPSAHHDNQIGYNKGYKVNHLWASIWGVCSMFQKKSDGPIQVAPFHLPPKKKKMSGVALNWRRMCTYTPIQNNR
jgi:hypothetical protein